MWYSLMNDVNSVCKEILDSVKVPEKQTYMSLPRPGVSKDRLLAYSIRGS